jgi:tRNA threonylcarbamoyladenosine biosynthesis protein TsaB
LIVLALDTALGACSVAVLDGEEVLAQAAEPMERGHQERLAPMVAGATAQAGLPFTSLQRVAVTVGPGSFTGLRVGLAFAKSMALALSIPCVGIGTLEALLASRPGGAVAARAAVVLDARRGNVYLQPFARGTALAPPANLSVEAARAELARLGFGADALLLGSGADLLAPGAQANPPDLIDPVAVARLATGRPAPDAMPAPLYLRAPDAKTIAERLAAAVEAKPA